MSVTVTLNIGGQPLVAELDDDALATIAAAIAPPDPEPASPFLTIPETADYLRCSRQRIDDLLSQRRLTRHKEGSRTLIARRELELYVRTDSKGGTL